MKTGRGIERISEFEYRLPREGAMRREGIVFASEEMMRGLSGDPCLDQVRNVATLPGIVGPSFAMPDIHWGYGFPIGGVAAFGEEDGIVSPGGVGYDINCGVRLLKTRIPRTEIAGRVRELTQALFAAIPAGVGSHHEGHGFASRDYDDILSKGAAWAVGRGFGSAEDLEYIEEHGRLPQADPERVSSRAKERGQGQLGTLGSGNHFVELGYVDEVYDSGVASELGLFPGELTVIVHTGSRGLGHQVCSDHLEAMFKASRRYGIELPDPQLCCAPIDSEEARDYLGAMAAAANFAFANRQLVTQYIRGAFEKVLAQSWESLGLRVVYDVCHNIAKFEEHRIGGQSRRVLVHRKGATRSFPARHPSVPQAYREVGQPVLIPGDMGRYSYVLVGTEKALETTFGSTCHGAGRLMSRNQAKKTLKGRNVERELQEQGITVLGASRATIAEEVPWAYKDVADVVAAVEGAGLSRKILKLKPLGVLKG
ncbi:MAG: RtcB family protein [Deltaproteobacteria bacterium]|nr:RtcB family protein [Deltaproteobacteria bacterium]